MKTLMISLIAIFLGACATIQQKSPAVSILVDLDPASVDRTVIVESITADKEGRLYMPDRVTGNILRVDPKSPKPVVVGRIEAREIKSKKVNPDGGGIAFNQQLWVVANERNAVVTVAPDGRVQEIAKNGSTGPLEFPSAIVFVGNTAYISNLDNPRRDNMDGNGQTASDGIGASIAQIIP
jgi:sugar lactone lactonase YvrE